MQVSPEAEAENTKIVTLKSPAPNPAEPEPHVTVSQNGFPI